MLRVSPDGQYAALDARDEDNDLWLWDFARGTMERLTSDPPPDAYPVWSKTQARRLYLSSGDLGDRGLFRMDLPRAPERIATGAGPAQQPTAITPDGKWLVVNGGGRGSAAAGLNLVPTEGGHEARPLPGLAPVSTNADLSPDGEWIAYQSSSAGRSEIYVHPFPDTAAFRRQIGEGTRPLWSPAGGELFYLDSARSLMSVRVDTKPTFSIGKPTKILDTVRVMTPGRSYDVSPDGKRFLVFKDAPGASQSIRQLEVVLNWHDELRRLTEPSK